MLDSCIFNFSLQLLRRVFKIQIVMFNTFFPLIHRDFVVILCRYGGKGLVKIALDMLFLFLFVAACKMRD